MGKTPPANTGDAGCIPGQEDPTEKGMAVHPSVLAWEVPQTEEPGDYSPWGPNLAAKQQRVIWKQTILTLSFIPYSCPTL